MELHIEKNYLISISGCTLPVKIIEIQKKYVVALINGNKIKIDKDRIICEISDPQKEKCIRQTEHPKEQKKKKRPEFVKRHAESKEQALIKNCRNCMELKNGNCFGSLQICDDFKPTPEMSKEELDRWPKKGTASRSKSDKYIVREHDFMKENDD